MPDLVLDAWAIMAWLKGQEPAAARVRLLLEAADRRERILAMNMITAEDELVMLAASLKARHAISYADAFAAATAMLHDVPLVTGDLEFQAMATHEKTLKLEWIGCTGAS